jgi:hypothetical protein
MNITPTISESALPYTVLGARGAVRQREADRELTLVLLNRRRAFDRAGLIGELERFEPDEIIDIETGVRSFDAEELTGRFPRLTLILLHAGMDWGSQVNLAMNEARGRFVLVLWSDLGLGDSHSNRRGIERMFEEDLLCSVPTMYLSSGQAVPNLVVPSLHGRKFKPIQLSPARDLMQTLYPFDYCGLYARDRFRLTGGFDGRIAKPYWQKLEFGLRCRLWGEKIVCRKSLRLGAGWESETEDATPDAGYRLFYLRTLAVRHRLDRGVLPWSALPGYLLHSGTEVWVAWNEFRAERRWVKRFGARYRMDVQSLVDLWEAPEE